MNNLGKSKKRWEEAAKWADMLNNNLSECSGYGGPRALEMYRVNSEIAGDTVLKRFNEYREEVEMSELSRSIRLATWISNIAIVVTNVNLIVLLIKW